MTDNSRQVPLGALAVQSWIGSQLHKFRLSNNWGSRWCSTFTTSTWHNRPNSAEFEDEWRINNRLGRATNDQSDCFSNFSYEIREHGATHGQAFRLTFDL